MTSNLPDEHKPGLAEYSGKMSRSIGSAQLGDLAMLSQILMAQALTLDSVYTELAQRSAINLSEHPDAAERYMRLALKAQSNSRATMEALAKLHQPREQTVRHVHVNEGGQAIVSDEFHHHAGGSGKNARSIKQSQEPSPKASIGASVLGPQSAGEAMPVPGPRRKKTVPSSRRPSRRTKR